MENEIQDPVTKGLLAILFGIVSVVLLFGLFSGGIFSSGSMASGGVTAGFLALLAKILVVVLVFALIAAAIEWVRKIVPSPDVSRLYDIVKGDPLLRGFSVVILGALSLVVIFFVVDAMTGPGYPQMRGPGNAMAMYQPAAGLAGLLNILADLLVWVVVGTLLVGIVVYVKAQYEVAKTKEERLLPPAEPEKKE